MTDLRIGAAILKEAVELEAVKQERLGRARKEEKAVAAAAANNIKLAFLDDRKTKMLRDQRERERREAQAAAAARETQTVPPISPASSAIPDMPGTGRSLVSLRSVDSPPGYHEDSIENTD